MKKCYTINDVALMSGLTARTIRNYIHTGILQGKKICGTWKFTPEEVNAFFEHPSVLPSIQAKRNGIVYGFIPDRNKTTNQMCTILDLPGEDGQEVSELFRTYYNTGNYGEEMQFFYEDFEEYPRVIIMGQADDVIKILNHFYMTRKTKVDHHEV